MGDLKYAIDRMLDAANKKNPPQKVVSLNVGQCRDILNYILALEKRQEAAKAYHAQLALPLEERVRLLLAGVRGVRARGKVAFRAIFPPREKAASGG